MKHKTRTKALSWLFSLALMLSLIPALGTSAQAVNPQYYVVGNMTNWETNETYLMSYSETNEDYELLGVSFQANDEIKIKRAHDSTIYPNGMDNAYTIAETGTYNVYFRPDGQGGDSWYQGYIFVEEAEATPETPSTYTLTIPSTLTVANSGWNATDGISATGTLADGKKLTVTASSGDEFALVSGENKVNYKLAASGDTDTTYDNATEKTTWEFATLSETAATQTMGIVVEDYSAKPAGTYQDTVTFTAKVEAVTAETALKPLLNETAAFGLELTKSGTKYSVTFSKANGSFTCTGIKVDDTVVTPKQVIDQGFDANFEEDGNGYGALAKVANDRLIVWLLGKTDNSNFTMPISFTISTGEYSNNSVSSVKVNGGEVLSALTYVEPQVG